MLGFQRNEEYMDVRYKDLNGTIDLVTDVEVNVDRGRSNNITGHYGLIAG